MSTSLFISASAKPKFERARKHRRRELLRGRRVAPAARVEHVQQRLRIKPAADAERDRLGVAARAVAERRLLSTFASWPSPG